MTRRLRKSVPPPQEPPMFTTNGHTCELLHKSNLTIEDRRQVRAKERQLYQEMQENATELTNLHSNKFNEMTDDLDSLYEDVCYPREANLDALNLEELVGFTIKQSNSLGSSDFTKFNRSDLIEQSRAKCCTDRTSAFDWNTLGLHAGRCFRSVPEGNFLFGLMDTQVAKQQRKPCRRAVQDKNVQTLQPTEYKGKKDRKDAQLARLEVQQTIGSEILVRADGFHMQV